MIVENFDVILDDYKINVKIVRNKDGNHLFVFTSQGKKRTLSACDLLAVVYDLNDKDEEAANALKNMLDHYSVNDPLYWKLRDAVMTAKTAWENRKNMVYKQQRCKTYLMKDENTGFTKIGKSVHPLKRESTLQAEKPTISLFKVCDRLVERELHNRFSTKHIRGEWYNLSKEDIEYILSKYDFKTINE